MPCSCKGGCLTNHCSCKKAGRSQCQRDCSCTNCHLGKTNNNSPVVIVQTVDEETKRKIDKLERKVDGVNQSLENGSRVVHSLAMKTESLTAAIGAPSLVSQEMVTSSWQSSSSSIQPVTASPSSSYNQSMIPSHGSPMVPWQQQRAQQQTLTYSGEFSIHHLGPHAFFGILEKQGLVLTMQNDFAGIRQYVYYFRGTNDPAMIVRVRGNQSMRIMVEVESRNAEIHNDFVGYLIREFPR